VISRLDHVVYPVSTSLFDDVIKQLTRAGFMEHTQKVHHSDGRVSAFFRVSGGYLEFSSCGSVCEEEQFAGSCSVWLCSTDLNAEVENLPTSHGEILAITKKAPFNDHEPAWLLLNLPARCAGDVQVSLIEYLRGIGAELSARVPDNGLFAIIAVSVICERAELEMHHYLASLGFLTGAIATEKERFCIGHQWLAFLSRHESLCAGPIDLSHVSCLVHMATVDLSLTTSMLKSADFILDELPGVGLLAQSRLAPSFCLVLDTGVDPEWHQTRLQARSG